MTWDDRRETVSVRPREDEPAGSVVEGWSRLFTYLVIAIMVGITIAVPFLGLVLAVAGASYLRAGDVHARRHRTGLLRLLGGPLTAPLDLVRGVAGTLVSLPYAAVFAVILPLAVMAAGAVDVEVHPLVAAAWGVGAAAYVLMAGPGVRAPRRHLLRVFTALANEPHLIAVVGGLLCALALAALAGAIVLQPAFAPMYELKNSISQALSRFQDSIRQRVA